MAALRIAALVAYLLAWLAVFLGAFGQAVASLRSLSAARNSSGLPDARAIWGTLLQGAAAVVLTGRLGSGPLLTYGSAVTTGWAAGAALLLAPAGAFLFLWALRAGRSLGPSAANTPATALVTVGPFALVRHPMYLGFLLLLWATGLLAVSGLLLLPATGLYLLGTELRIAEEETGLAERFGEHHKAYCQAVRFRYLPFLR